LLLAALPVSEVRGAIPCLALSGCPPETVLLAYVVSTAVGVAVYFFIEEILEVAYRFSEKYWKRGKKIIEKVMERVHRGASEKVQKYGTLGLIAFVAVQLPGTGVWSGALAAYLLGIEPKRAVLALAAGNAIATAVVSMSYLFK
jgi:uncharacterized membrane protein